MSRKDRRDVPHSAMTLRSPEAAGSFIHGGERLGFNRLVCGSGSCDLLLPSLVYVFFEAQSEVAAVLLIRAETTAVKVSRLCCLTDHLEVCSPGAGIRTL